METKNIALVLSSGGARGLAHIGAIRALHEQGYRITAVSGTSMGALVGAILANGKLPEFSDFITNLTRIDVIRLMDLAVSKQGIIKGERVFGEIKRFIGEGNIEDLPIPFAAVATDLFNHREIIFRHGSLFSAVRASAAIPTVLLPLQYGNDCFVDGALVNPLPINRVSRSGNDRLVAVNVNAPRQPLHTKKETPSNSSYHKIREFVNQKWNGAMSGRKAAVPPIHGFFDIVSGSFEMMQHKLTEASLKEQKPDLLINLPVNMADMLEFYKAKDIIETGYRATLAGLRLPTAETNAGDESGLVREWII